MPMKRLLTAFALSAALIGLGQPAHAQEFPNETVRLIVTASPGGGTDQIARLFGSKLQEMWGQSVVVENKSGGGGNIGAQFVARSKPDGHTLLVSFGGVITINPYLYNELGYDPIKDLTPVTLLATAPYVLAVNPEVVPSKTVQEFIQYLKSRPNELSWASTAKGSPDHLSGELFQQMSGTKMTHIPYKGGMEGLLDVIGGRVQLGFFTIPTALPHIQSGKLRALGSSDTKRVPLLPDVPTIDESGLKGYEVLTWYGVWAPAGTPDAVVQKIHADLKKVLESEEVSKRLRDMGYDPKGLGSAEFAKFISNESQKYGKIIDAAGLEKN
jgi:tripartite-type tricarboxylate transporter receptor subunit TctC